MTIENLLKTIDEKKLQLKDFLNEKYLYNPSYFEHLKVLLTYHSNAIEGNTLSQLQTAMFIEKGLTSSGKTINEHLEAINHYRAFDYVYERSFEKKPFNQFDIKNIHSFILDKINDNEKGKYRQVDVKIAGSNSVLPSHFQVAPLMDELESQLKEDRRHPVIRAIDFHYNLVSIHPFIDGNGRTSRLLMNGILLQNNYPVLNVKKEVREEYLKVLEGKQTQNQNKEYTEFMCKQLDNSLDYHLSLKKEHTLKKTITPPQVTPRKAKLIK